MERLTKTYSDGTHGAVDNLPSGEHSYGYKGLLLEALGKYEDLEEFRYRLAVKYGLIEEKERPIVFCFEEMEESHD